jgi:hypothetical protein
LFTQEIYANEETFGISSPSTLEEDHEARQESRQAMNMIPNDLRTEALLTVYFGTPNMFITLWFGFDYGTNPPLGTLII